MSHSAITTPLRSNSVRSAAAIVIIASLLAPTACLSAEFGQQTETVKTRYLPIGSIRYERVNLSGTDSESSPTAFTVTRVPAEDSNRTRMAVSGAFHIDKPKTQNLRLVAKDHAGKLHLPTVQTVAAARGSKRRVITLLCEFALSEQSIHELVVQRRVLVSEVDLGMVRARVIIDEDEEDPPIGYDQDY